MKRSAYIYEEECGRMTNYQYDYGMGKYENIQRRHNSKDNCIYCVMDTLSIKQGQG